MGELERVDKCIECGGKGYIKQVEGMFLKMKCSCGNEWQTLNLNKDGGLQKEGRKSDKSKTRKKFRNYSFPKK